MNITDAVRIRRFLAGVRGELPLLVGVAPFGMIYGVLALEAGIPATQAQMISSIVFAGSSQFILTQLVTSGAPAVVMILTVFVVNLRHALYSAGIAPYIQRLSTAWKLLLAYLLTDEAFAIAILEYQRVAVNPASSIVQPPDGAISAAGDAAPTADFTHWYFLGAGLALWSTWQISTAVGIFLGAVVPASWELDFTLALTFIALVVPNLKDHAAGAAALCAGAVALLAFGLPYKLGLIVAAVAGVAAGMLAESKEWAE